MLRYDNVGVEGIEMTSCIQQNSGPFIEHPLARWAHYQDFNIAINKQSKTPQSFIV